MAGEFYWQQEFIWGREKNTKETPTHVFNSLFTPPGRRAILKTASPLDLLIITVIMNVTFHPPNMDKYSYHFHFPPQFFFKMAVISEIMTEINVFTPAQLYLK